jgi:uncharacterized membrane protein
MKLVYWFEKNYLLIAVLVVAAFLRLYHLCYQSIWVDELHTMIETNPAISFKESNDIILYREGTPRLYFFLVKIFNSVFGHTVFNARLISVFFGLLSVVFINKLGTKMFNKNIGLYSAVLLTFNLFLIEYSQEARTYSMLVFFVILAFYGLILFIKKSTYTNALFLGIVLGLVTNAHPIGILNVLSIYIVLIYILFIEKKARIDLFKKIFTSGIVFIVVFLPTIPTIEMVSNFKSFWIVEPSLPYLFQIFNQLLGSSLVITFLFFLIYVVFVYKSIQIISRKSVQVYQNYLIGFIIVNVWIWFEVTIILLKSYFGISIALHRYFIAIVPAFILIIAVTIDFIKNEGLKKMVVFLLITYLIADIFLIKDFYSVNRKSQFDKVANFIEDKNTSKYKIVSSWGWLMTYYFNDSNGLFTEEKVLNNYIDEMRKGTTSPSSFWYVDGNSNKFELTAENKIYVDQNFIIRNKYDVHDAWCVEFKSIHNEEAFIELKKFQPSMFDGSGAMIFVENQTSAYPKINLEKGDYLLCIKGYSLPEKPINNENAHFNILVNKSLIKSLYLSNIQNQKPVEIPIKHDGGIFKLELVYDNDLVIGSQDRNAVINTINLKRKE